MSPDFEKAYDKIVIHSLVYTPGIYHLIEWRTAHKRVSYVINFMTKEKIVVRVNNNFSSKKSQNNGIPQSCPI